MTSVFVEIVSRPADNEIVFIDDVDALVESIEVQLQCWRR